MTKQEFLRRCETVWGKGIDDEIFSLLLRWVDFVLRFDHTMFGNGQTQGDKICDFIEMERQRLGAPFSCNTLAGDKAGYKLVDIVSVLAHPCQKCAEDANAWHTRFGFCDHKRDVELDD